MENNHFLKFICSLPVLAKPAFIEGGISLRNCRKLSLFVDSRFRGNDMGEIFSVTAFLRNDKG
jgi:hypothetical protein